MSVTVLLCELNDVATLTDLLAHMKALRPLLAVHAVVANTKPYFLRNLYRNVALEGVKTHWSLLVDADARLGASAREMQADVNAAASVVAASGGDPDRTQFVVPTFAFLPSKYTVKQLRKSRRFPNLDTPAEEPVYHKYRNDSKQVLRVKRNGDHLLYNHELN